MKKFLIKISYTVLPVWLLLVGMATYLWMTNDNTGDLMRLGLIDSGPEYTDSIRSQLLPKVYYLGQDNDSLLRSDTCDVLVVGDSFSHGGGVGKQGDYVNYLAHDSGRKVVVFTPANKNMTSPMQIAQALLKSKAIDSTHVKNIVVEEVERYLVGRHSGFIAGLWHIDRPNEVPVVSNPEPDKKSDTGPLLRVKDYVFYHLFGANPIYKVRLSAPVFGGANPDVLYFYNEDVELGFDVTEAQQRSIKSCYDEVIASARERGVNLIFLLACDKYDLYQSYIIDNPYPPKTLNEDIERWMAPEMGRFVIAKCVLLPLVDQGVKDVYLYNDTHWSPSSSRIIAGEVIKKLK